MSASLSIGEARMKRALETVRVAIAAQEEALGSLHDAERKLEGAIEKE